MEKYSFLVSIYKNSNIDEMKICVDSMINQTYQPDQIVIVIDGPVPEDLVEYVNGLVDVNPELYTLVPLEENMGQGKAFHIGMKECRNNLVARMDTDDYTIPNRCEKQVKFFEEHPEYSVIGGNMAEFIGSVDNVVGYRNVPETHDEIMQYMKMRCPMNQITTMMKKDDAESVGGYQHWFMDEDSYLWLRMRLAGLKFYNMQEILAYARVGEDMYKRRGGYKYYKSERDLYKLMYKNKIINWFEYQKVKTVRFIVQVLMPNWMRQWFFKKFARKQGENKDEI